MTTHTQSQSQPTPLRRGLPIVWATVRENKIAMISICGYMFTLIMMCGAIGQDFEMAGFAKVASSGGMKMLLGSGSLPNQDGFIPFFGIQTYGSFFTLVFGGSLAFFVGSTVARNLENGMLELALSRPVSRTRYYLERWLGAVFMIVILSSIVLIGVAVADLIFAKTDINWQRLMATQAFGTLVWFACIGIGMLMSVLFDTGRAGGGAALGVIAVMYLFNAIGTASDTLSFLNTVSLIKYAPLMDMLFFGKWTWWHPLVLVMIGLTTGLVGLWHFRRRDLAS